MTPDALTPAITLVIASTALLCGCESLSGLGGGSRYACQAPEGVACQSVSGTYANVAATGRAASAPEPAPATPAATRAALARTAAPAVAPAPQAATSPLRSAARVLRLWIKPWEDLDGDLFDQGYVYVQVDSGLWLLDHLQRSIRESYAPLRPPVTPPGSRDARDGPAAATGTPPSLQTRPPGIQRRAPAGTPDALEDNP